MHGKMKSSSLGFLPYNDCVSAIWHHQECHRYCDIVYTTKDLQIPPYDFTLTGLLCGDYSNNLFPLLKKEILFGSGDFKEQHDIIYAYVILLMP